MVNSLQGITTPVVDFTVTSHAVIKELAVHWAAQEPVAAIAVGLLYVVGVGLEKLIVHNQACPTGIETIQGIYHQTFGNGPASSCVTVVILHVVVLVPQLPATPVGET